MNRPLNKKHLLSLMDLRLADDVLSTDLNEPYPKMPYDVESRPANCLVSCIHSMTEKFVYLFHPSFVDIQILSGGHYTFYGSKFNSNRRVDDISLSFFLFWGGVVFCEFAQKISQKKNNASQKHKETLTFYLYCKYTHTHMQRRMFKKTKRKQR